MIKPTRHAFILLEYFKVDIPFIFKSTTFINFQILVFVIVRVRKMNYTYTTITYCMTFRMIAFFISPKVGLYNLIYVLRSN